MFSSSIVVIEQKASALTEGINWWFKTYSVDTSVCTDYWHSEESLRCELTALWRMSRLTGSLEESASDVTGLIFVSTGVNRKIADSSLKAQDGFYFFPRHF